MATYQNLDFGYDADSKTLYAEASTLGGFPPKEFTVVTPVRTVEFHEHSNQVDAEGDLQFVRYKTADRQFTAIVFND